jgi:glutathione peroxidase-family protein
MATFYDLAEKDAAGQMVKFDKFKGKVVYGVNVARYTYIHTHIQKYTYIYACAYTYE